MLWKLGERKMGKKSYVMRKMPSGKLFGKKTIHIIVTPKENAKNIGQSSKLESGFI